MGALLRLHYEQHFSRGAACKQLGINEPTAYKFFRRFEESGLSLHIRMRSIIDSPNRDRR
ncbi:TPA: helix-turn-helix domain-containing protein [Salmonella enterica subsp. enterica serovar Java]